MLDISADKLAQRIFAFGLLTTKQVEVALADAGGRGRASLNDLISLLLERELLTNWQISRVCENHRQGYFYGKWRLLYMIGAGSFARASTAPFTQKPVTAKPSRYFVKDTVPMRQRGKTS